MNTGTDNLLTVIAAIVAVVVSVSGAIIPWLTWRRESAKDAGERNSRLNDLRHEIEEDLWQKMKAVIDQQQKQIDELQSQIDEREKEILRLKDELDRAYQRIRALEKENRELKNGTR